jgi:hypothetical protein
MPEPNSGCLLWLGRLNRDGYGTFGRELAHRRTWRAHFGAIPDGLQVLHRCDVPCCVNPAHLWLGTHTDNMRDRSAKGRHHWQQRPMDCPLAQPGRITRPKGERHSHAKLTLGQVIEIRTLAALGNDTHEALALRFGMGRVQITRIINRTRWRHI